MFRICMWCGNKIQYEPHKGRRPNYCCGEHLNRHRWWKYQKSKLLNFHWKDGVEKSRFYATQRRLRIAADPMGFVHRQLDEMKGENIPKQESEDDAIRTIYHVTDEDQVANIRRFFSEDVRIGDIFGVAVKKIGRL